VHVRGRRSRQASAYLGLVCESADEFVDESADGLLDRSDDEFVAG
jgi:hypothetical protein